MDENVAYDPYALPIDGIEEPPASLWSAFRKIGPGIILAGTIVGSGELILTTNLGAKHGFVFLWLILFSCVIKVFVQLEIGRFAISSGKPTLGALFQIGPGTPIGWILVWWWFAMMFFTVFQLGAMVGSVGQSLNLAIPDGAATLVSGMNNVNSDWAQYLSVHQEYPWAFLTCLITMALIYGGGYKRIEWLTTLIVISVTLVTVLGAFSLAFTEYAYSWSDIAEGFTFKIPPDGIDAAFAIFGITGVGATELFYYPYWCLEKGYARYVGPRDDSEDWERRAKGWIRVMYLDAWVSMVVFTLSTVAFYIMGAAVLHAQGLAPAKEDLINALSKMYIGPFGNWARILFLIGAGAVLFKTLYLSCAANSRLTVDFFNLIGWIKARNARVRARWISLFCLVFPALSLFFYLFARDPQFMVQVGGIAQAATLPMIGIATLYFRYWKLDSRLHPHWITDVMLWFAVIAIVIVAAYVLPGKTVEFYKWMIPSTPS